MAYRFFPDGFVAGSNGGDAVAGGGGGGGEADCCSDIVRFPDGFVAGSDGGDAVAGGGGGGGEADCCSDIVHFRFFMPSVVCFRGSLGGSRKGGFVFLARGAKPLAACVPFITSPRLLRFDIAHERGRLNYANYVHTCACRFGV